MDCRDRCFRQGGNKAHIAFRDKASQHFLKPTYRRGRLAEDADQPEPEGEPSDAPSPRESYVAEMLHDRSPVLTTSRPSLTDMRAHLACSKAWHARAPTGDLSSANLVPFPEHQLWQECPYVPFDKLRSTVAQSRLFVCRPLSGLEQDSCAGGAPRYAHNTGGVKLRRWEPLRMANTMVLILNKHSGKATGLTPDELDAVYECLSSRREEGANKVLAFFGTVFESYDNALRDNEGRVQARHA